MAYKLQALEWPPKEAGEVLDFILNWKDAPGGRNDYVAVLNASEGETITSVSHEIVSTPAGDAGNPLTIDSESTFDSDRQTVVWLSGGVKGDYVIEATITTSADRTYVRAVSIKVID